MLALNLKMIVNRTTFHLLNPCILFSRMGNRRSTALFLLLRIPRPDLEPDRRPLESKRLTNLVFQEALEAEVQLDVAVGEENKRGRGDGGLSPVEDSNPLGHGH